MIVCNKDAKNKTNVKHRGLKYEVCSIGSFLDVVKLKLG